MTVYCIAYLFTAADGTFVADSTSRWLILTSPALPILTSDSALNALGKSWQKQTETFQHRL